MFHRRIQRVLAAVLAWVLTLSATIAPGSVSFAAPVDPSEPSAVIDSPGSSVRTLTLSPGAPSTSYRWWFPNNADQAAELQWWLPPVAAAAGITSVSLELVPLTDDGQGGYAEGTAVAAGTLTPHAENRVFTTPAPLTLKANANYRVKATAAFAPGAAPYALPVGVLLTPPQTKFSTAPVSLSTAATNAAPDQFGSACVPSFFHYTGASASLQWHTALAPGNEVASAYAQLYRLVPMDADGLDMINLGGLGEMQPGQERYGTEAVQLTPGSYRIVVCATAPAGAQTTSFSMSHNFRLADGPPPSGPEIDLTTPYSLTRTFHATSPYAEDLVPFRYNGTQPVPAEIEIAVADTAAGGLSAYASHLIPSTYNNLQWEIDPNVASFRTDLVPAGGKYTISGLVLPGQNRITLTPVLLGPDDAKVTGEIPYTVTIRTVGALPTQGRTVDLGAPTVKTAFANGLWMKSIYRFTVAQAGFHRLSAPSLLGHSAVQLSRVTRTGAKEDLVDPQAIHLIAAAKYPAWLDAGEWELTLTQSPPNAQTETPLPADPAATVPVTLELAPWTQADGALPPAGRLDLTTSQAVTLKVPQAWTGSYLVVVKAPTGAAAQFSVSTGTSITASTDVPAGQYATTTATVNAGQTFSFGGNTPANAGYHLQLIPLSLVGESPVTLKGSIKAPDASSSNYFNLSPNLPRNGWYSLQARTTAPRGSISIGSTSFPLHAADQGGSAPAAKLPIFGGGNLGITLEPGDALPAEWEVELGQAQAFPSRTITLTGNLLSGETTQITMPLGVNAAENAQFDISVSGPPNSTVNARLTCDGLFACINGEMEGKEDPATEMTTRYGTPFTLKSDAPTLTITRNDVAGGTLTYHMTLSLPAPLAIYVTDKSGGQSILAPDAKPISLALGEGLEIDARDQGAGVDDRGLLTGRSLPVTWSVAGSTAPGVTPGKARIDRFGRLVGEVAGTVIVTADYSEDAAVLSATREVTITPPKGPDASLMASLDPVKMPKWVLSGYASVPEPKRITAMDLRLDGTGDWVQIPSAWDKSFNLDPATLFPALDAAEGWHNFELRATDSAGGVTTVSAQFLVDRTPPTVAGIRVFQDRGNGPIEITDGQLNGTDPKLLSTTLTATAEDKAGAAAGGAAAIDFSYRPVGTNAWRTIGMMTFGEQGTTWPAYWYLAGLPTNQYEVRAEAVDKAGNRSRPVTVTYQVTGTDDTEKPTNVYLTAKDGKSGQDGNTYLKGSAVFTLGAFDAGSGVAAGQIEYRAQTGLDAQKKPVFGAWTKMGAAADYPGDNQTWEATVDSTAMADGYYQFRLVATDLAGNQGYTDDWSVLNMAVMNGAPADPAGLTAVFLPPDATMNLGPRVKVTWSPVFGVSHYTLEAQAVAPGTAPDPTKWQYAGYASAGITEYEDREAPTRGKDLLYRLVVTDPFTRQSPGAKTVAIKLEPDETPPVVRPGLVGGAVKGTVRGTVKIRVPASDNQAIKQVKVTYAGPGGAGGTLTGAVDIATGESTISWPTDGLPDGDYTLTIIAIDDWGNSSAPVNQTATVDNLAPEPPASATATAPEGKMQADLTWTASPTPDVAQYQVIRAFGSETTVIAVAPATTLSYTDTDVIPQGKYRYGIRAMDKAGNLSIQAANTEEVLIGQDKTPPTVRLASGSATKQLKARESDGLAVAPILFDASPSTDNVGIALASWDPGDGGAPLPGLRVTHVYTRPGRYLATVTVKDAAGYASTGSMVVVIKEAGAPSVVVTVRNQNTQAPVSGATVLVDGQQSYVTDGQGQVEITGDPGPVKLTLYAPNYLGATDTVEVPKTGQAAEISYLTPGKIVVGELTQHRLTLDEIKSLGIDMADPANNWVTKFEVPVNFQGNEGGGGGGGGGSAQLFVNAENEVVASKGCKGCAIGLVDMGTNDEGEPQQGVAIFKIDGEAKWLKEFFKVDAVIVNPSAKTFVLKRGKLQLYPGNGLAVVPTASTEASAGVSVPDIPGQSSFTTSWVLRGDRKGTYPIKAEYNGMLDFGARQVPAQVSLQTKEPIIVYGQDQIEVKVEAPKEIKEGETIQVKVHMINKSPVPAYGLSLTMKEEHLLEQGEEATKKVDALKGGDTWTTVWHLKAPGNGPADLDGLWGTDNTDELDPVENPNFFATGRVVYRNGDGTEHPVVGAVVSLNGRRAALTDSKGAFEAGADQDGTYDVVVSGGTAGWRGAWHTTVTIPKSAGGGRQEARVEKHPKADAEGTGFLISGSIATSLQSGLKALEKTGVHDPAILTKIAKWAQDEILNKGLNGDKRSVDPTDEETLRRLRTVVSLMVVNDQNAANYLDKAADSLWDGSTGTLSALIQVADAGNLLAKAVKRIPGIRQTALPEILENGIDAKLEPMIKKAAGWAQDLAERKLKNLSSDLKDKVGAKVEDGLTQAAEQLKETITKQVDERVAKPATDAAKTAFKNHILAAYKKGSDQALENAYTYADLSTNDSTRWWTPGTFGDVSSRFSDLRSISEAQNGELLGIEQRLLAVSVAGEILEGVGERSEAVSDFTGSLPPNPAAVAVTAATTALQKVSESANLAYQLVDGGPRQIEIALKLIRMTTGSRSLLYLNERMAFGAFSKTWAFTKPVQTDSRVIRLPGGPLGNFLLTPLTTGPIGDLLKKGGFKVTLHSPADLYICDGTGKCLGIDPATGQEVPMEKRIPGGIYSGPKAEPEFVIIPGPAKDLRLNVQGTGEGGDVTLEFTRMGYQQDPTGGKAPADNNLILNEAVTGGQQINFSVSLSDAEGEQAGTPARPNLLRNGAKLVSVAVAAPNGALTAARDQALELPVHLTDGGAVRKITVDLPWNSDVLGTPTLTAGAGFTLETSALTDGQLTATLSAKESVGDTGTVAFTISTTPTALGQTFVRLSAPNVTLADGSGQALLHLATETSLAVNDGTTTLTGSVNALFGTAIGRAGSGRATDRLLTAREARALKVRELTAAASDVVPDAGVKLWRVDREGNVSDAAPAFETQTKADGRFSLAGVTPGEYLLEVSAAGLLARRQRVTIGLGETTLGSIDLLAGDLNADGVIDLLDFVTLYQNLGALGQVREAALGQRLARMDLDRNGELTADEAARLAPFFRRSAADQ